jgi:hypothetical protein
MPSKRELVTFRINKNHRWQATVQKIKKQGPTHSAKPLGRLGRTHGVQAHGVTVTSHNSTRKSEKQTNEDSGRLAMSPATLCWARLNFMDTKRQILIALFILKYHSPAQPFSSPLVPGQWRIPYLLPAVCCYDFRRLTSFRI